MNPSEKYILEIDSVELSFGDRRILSGVYLAVETGGVTAVLGRNGCGKSCLMKILCGSLRADFRSMRIEGYGMTVSGPTRCVTSRSRVLSRAG